MPYFHFLKKDLIKIARIFPEFLKKCDNKGNFDASSHLKHHQKFFKDKVLIKDIDDCEKGI